MYQKHNYRRRCLKVWPAPEFRVERFWIQWKRSYVREARTLWCYRYCTPKPTGKETADFLDKLKDANPRAAILFEAPKHSEEFVPIALKDGCPTPLGGLYEAETVSLTTVSFLINMIRCLRICRSQMLSVSLLNGRHASSRLWYTYRCGRVTASKFGAIIKSDDDQPRKYATRANSSRTQTGLTKLQNKSKLLIQLGVVSTLSGIIVC